MKTDNATYIRMYKIEWSSVRNLTKYYVMCFYSIIEKEIYCMEYKVYSNIMCYNLIYVIYDDNK